MASIYDYLGLVTSEHADKAKFVATLTAIVQPLVDGANTQLALPAAFDLDEAVGVQLDAVGEWVGVKRTVSVPLEGVYFSLDDDVLGFDAGYFKGRFDPLEGPTQLNDENYRLLLRAKIASNHWDGTIEAARAVMAGLLPANNVYVQDNQDMSITVAVVGVTMDAVIRSLMTGGYLALKPEGVRVDGYLVPSPSDPSEPADPSDRIFGFDTHGDVIGGLDAGCWPIAA